MAAALQMQTEYGPSAMLERLYEELEHRESVWSFLRNEYQRLSRDASALYLEFSDYVESVENSPNSLVISIWPQFFDRPWPASTSASWKESVNRKMNAPARISELLQEKVNARRSHWLEIIVVALILVELVSKILRLM